MSDEQTECSDDRMIALDATLKPIGDLTIFEAAQFHEDL